MGFRAIPPPQSNFLRALARCARGARTVRARALCTGAGASLASDPPFGAWPFALVAGLARARATVHRSLCPTYPTSRS